MDKENTDLTIEAIKLVELLSSLNIEDFQMNQWIFLIDGYGMKLETGKNSDQKLHEVSNQYMSGSDRTDVSKLQKSGRLNSMAQGSQLGGRDFYENQEVFKTFIVRFIGNQQYSFYNVEKPQDGTNQISHFDFSDDEADRLSFGNNFGSDKVPASPHTVPSGATSTLSSHQPQDSVLRNVATGMAGAQNSQDFIVSKNGEFDPRLQDQACHLQKSLND